MRIGLPLEESGIRHLDADAIIAAFNMIDTVAMGIRKVFKMQQERLFPMPDYFFMKPDEVIVRVYGKTLDENYMRMLYDRPEFDIETVYLLDNEEIKDEKGNDRYSAEGEFSHLAKSLTQDADGLHLPIQGYLYL